MPTYSPFTENIKSRAFLVMVVLVYCVGCGNLQSGGGAKSVASASGQNSVVFGISGEKQLGFVMFTDIPSLGTVASGGSSWTGNITPKNGKPIEYKKVSGGLDIDGTQYDLAKGKVFLVSSSGNTVSTTQINLSIGDSNYDAEIERLRQTKEVREFLSAH